MTDDLWGVPKYRKFTNNQDRMSTPNYYDYTELNKKWKPKTITAKAKRDGFNPTREEVAAATEEYLKNGGSITVITEEEFYTNLELLELDDDC